MCDNCNYNIEDIENDRLDICKKCRSQKPSLLITKTKALEIYPLNSNDLDTIRHYQYTGVFVTYLYLIKDLDYVCTKKYGGKDNADKIKAKKINKKLERKKYIEDSKEFRRKELDDYLKSIFLPGLRSDSVLCQNYINSGENAGFTKEQIGVIMIEMKFFYEKTNYSTILYKLKGDELNDRKEYKGWYCWTQDDEDEVRERAKKTALYEYVEKNCNNHTFILDIPKSLKGLADDYYNRLSRNKDINRNRKNVIISRTIKEIADIFKESNRQFKNTKANYLSLFIDH